MVANKTNEKNLRRLNVLIIGLLIIFSFLFVNAQQYAYGFLIYIVLGMLSIFFNYSWNKITKRGDLEGLSDNWVRESFIGVGLAIVTIVVGFVVPGIGAIGFPSVSQSIIEVIGTLGKFIILVPGASIFESVYLVNVLTDFFMNVLGINKYISLGLMASASSLFHVNAYGGSLIAAGGSFFSAFLMFYLFGLWAEYRNDLAGIITWHGGLNYWNAFLRVSFGL